LDVFLDASGLRVLDMIFPKDVQSDNPGYLELKHVNLNIDVVHENEETILVSIMELLMVIIVSGWWNGSIGGSSVAMLSVGL
jgi:hypothetical protein